eukprot:9663942-Alexandrium_andersonii.AAC.1
MSERQGSSVRQVHGASPVLCGRASPHEPLPARRRPRMENRVSCYTCGQNANGACQWTRLAKD